MSFASALTSFSRSALRYNVRAFASYTPPGNMAGVSLFSLGNVQLQCGKTLPDASLAYKTYGTLNAAKDNVIVYPSWYSGFIADNEWLIGEGKALDPAKYFIIVPCALGNGQSSAPSNTPEPFNGPRFPNISLYDNITLQHRLVTSFGIEKIKLVTGWSMGAQQTFQWGSLYPDMVERIAPFCGSAKTSPHNFVFLEGVKAGIITDVAWKEGWYDEQPKRGLRSVGRIYAGWGLTQPFYKQELWRGMGFASLEDFLVGFWERFFLLRDANNMLAMLWSWQNADISANHLYNGDIKKALGAIKAKSVVLSPTTDLYFPIEDNAWEVEQMTGAAAVKHVEIPGAFGHFAGGGLCDADTAVIDKELKELLAQ